MPPHAVVVGAGIGGLTAALALRRLGCEVTVLERRTELAEVDTGFLLWAFAIKRLHQLGLSPGLERIGRPLERLVTKSAHGTPLSDISLDPLNERIGVPSYDVHRADLQRLLADAVGRDRIMLASRCAATEQDRTAARAVLEDGPKISGDLLIGADGVHSAIRRHVAGGTALRRDAVAIWRGIAELPEHLVPDGVHIRVMGPGALFGLGRLGAKARWYAGAWAPELRYGGDQQAKGDELTKRFGRWCSPVPEAIEATDPQSVLLNDAPRLPRLRSWTRSRVVLLGDAAHATFPSLASGGGMAIEDACVLAECLDASANSIEALRHYERRRRRPAVRIQRTANAFAYLLAWRRAPALRLRDLGFRRLPGLQRRAISALMKGRS